MRLSTFRNSRRGSAMVEFAVVMPFWITVFFGTVAMGTNLTRSIQVVQASRDLANMYARGTDFSSTGFQNLLTGGGSPPSASIVQGMDLSSTGNAVIYLSQVRHVYPADVDCNTSCANANKDVFVNRVVFGNTTLFSSYLGAMPTTDLDAHDNAKNPATQTLDRTNQNQIFASSYVVPGNGNVSYVAEVFMASPDLSFLGFGKAGNYSRQVF